MRGRWSFLFLMCLLGQIACRIPAEPMGGGASRPGVLRIEASTSGDSLDADGYVVRIDGIITPERLPLNGSFRITDLAPGPHELRLTQVDGQCVTRDPGDALSIVARSAPETLTIRFRVTCARRLSRLDDRILWETDRNGQVDIYAMRPDGGDVVNVTNNGWNNATVAISADGFEISYLRMISSGGSGCPAEAFGLCWGSGPTFDLYSMRADRSALTRILGANDGAATAAWSPDWRRIVLVQGACAFALGPCTQRLVVSNADGTGRNAITDPATAYSADSPRWSPDGTRIAFMAKTDTTLTGPRGIYLINPDGSGLERIVQCDPFCGPLAWSPDGTRLVFSGAAHPYPEEPAFTYIELFVVNADGTGQRQLTHANRGAWSIAWSPDGTRIAFVAAQSLWVINSDGTGETQLSNGEEVESFAWSPDATRLAFDRLHSSSWEISVVNRDGTGLVNLTRHSSADRHPVWTRATH